MKKIMFNDEFLLTQAVLEGRKTQTRRIIKCRKTFKGEWVAGFNIHIRPSDKKVVGLPCMYDADESEFDGGEILPKYKVGEVIAVALEKPRDFDPFGQAGFAPFGYNMTDPLKSWCWGSILFYPFKISRFS